MSAPVHEGPFSALANELSTRFHLPLGHELPSLRFMAQKVAQVHGPGHPAAAELGQEVRALADHAEAWLALESREILPRLSPGALGTIPVTRSKMKEGHEKRKEAMARIRVLTESYRPWEGACDTVARLYAGLGRLENILAEYTRVEEESLDAFLPG